MTQLVAIQVYGLTLRERMLFKMLCIKKNVSMSRVMVDLIKSMLDGSIEINSVDSCEVPNEFDSPIG